MSAAIEVDHVTKQFRLGQLSGVGHFVRNGWRRLRGLATEASPDFRALDDVSFSVARGEVLGIIGHNGAGKSTMLKILAGISQPTSGAVKVRGRVAPLIEVGAGLVPDMTGRENVFLNASILGMSRAEIVRKFDEIVAFSELEAFIDTPVKRYSSGMQIKLGFSIATSVEAEILIVDEVLAVGDLAFQRKCFDRMESLIKQQGRTVLLVSHNIRQVERICNRVLMLDHGKLAKIGQPKDVCDRFYELSEEAIRQQSRSARAESNGQVDLIGVRLLDDAGLPLNSLHTGVAVTIEVALQVREPLLRPVFGLGVHTTDMIYLATEVSERLLSEQEIQPGRILVSARISSLQLLAGSYGLRLGIDAGEVVRNVFYAENICPLVVQRRESDPSRATAEGFFPLGFTWQVKAENQAIAAPFLAERQI